MLSQQLRVRFAAGLLVMMLALSSWSTSQSHAQNHRLKVVASFSILADVVQQVAGDAIELETLIPLGANPHSFEPSARHVVTVSQADVVFVVGIGFEESLLDVLQEAAGEKVVNTSACVPVLAVNAASTLETPVHNDADEDTPCHAHQETIIAAFYHAGTLLPEQLCTFEHDTGTHKHANGACDPHVWTNPVNVARWVLLIRDTLAQLDPDRAHLYTANADAYLAELITLDAEIAAMFETVPEAHRFLVTHHLTSHYFATRYGLTPVGVIIPGGSTSAEPSVQDVIRLIETIQTYYVPAIFTETTVNEVLARQIADETGAEIVQLYTGSLSSSAGPADTYLRYMRFNAAQIAEALQ